MSRRLSCCCGVNHNNSHRHGFYRSPSPHPNSPNTHTHVIKWVVGNEGNENGQIWSQDVKWGGGHQPSIATSTTIVLHFNCDLFRSSLLGKSMAFYSGFIHLTNLNLAEILVCCTPVEYKLRKHVTSWTSWVILPSHLNVNLITDNLAHTHTAGSGYCDIN